MAIDLTHVPVVDNHCHGIYRDYMPSDTRAWRAHFTESYDPQIRHEHVATTAYYRRLIREMAAFFGCEPDEAAVLTARRVRHPHELARDLLRAANIETLCVDRGFPTSDDVAPDEEFAGEAAVRIAPMLRLEVLMQNLIGSYDTLEAVTEALQAALVDVRSQGYVALKTIVAYRTGLAIQTWAPEDVAISFREAHREARERGSLRLAHKPLLDTLLHVAFAIAAEQEVPMQFHTGYGDSDADMLLANPLNLRAVLQNQQYRGMPIVLLHESYPYTRQGAYLAAIYDNVYLDLSYGIPVLGYGEMLAFTRQALGVAPIAKLMYSSDGVGVPEVHWASALHGRRVLGEALGDRVSYGEVSNAEAETAGAAILRDNANRVYGL